MSEILTVVIITYNHAKYIRQALDSVLSQKTSFKYSVKIFDDCSTDGAQKIIEEYEQKYPQKVRVFLSGKNLGGSGHGNGLRALASVETKYFCILEGDDYWCDNNKLQTQIDVLEADSSLVGCCHNTYIVQNENITEDNLMRDKNAEKINRATISDIIGGKIYSHTSSFIYRSKPLGRSVEESALYKMKYCYPLLGDFFNMMYFSQFGDVFYIDKPMSVYRIHQSGIWSKMKSDDRIALNIDMMLLYRRLINKKFHHDYNVATYYGVKNFLNSIKSKKALSLKRIKYKFLMMYLKSYFDKQTRLSFFLGKVNYLIYRLFLLIKA